MRGEEKGNSVQGDARRERMPGEQAEEEGEKESFRAGAGGGDEQGSY